MSFNKTFQHFLKEDNTNPTIPSPGNINSGLNSNERERLLEEINSMLVVLTDTPALNPYYIIERIKTRLKLSFGLTFDSVYFLGNVGSFEKILVAHNDVVSVEGGSLPPNDNAWLKFFPHGLGIKFQFLKSGPLYHLNTEIFAVPDPPVPPSISEA
jgi:hypothetical protein